MECRGTLAESYGLWVCNLITLEGGKIPPTYSILLKKAFFLLKGYLSLQMHICG